MVTGIHSRCRDEASPAGLAGRLSQSGAALSPASHVLSGAPTGRAFRPLRVRWASAPSGRGSGGIRWTAVGARATDGPASCSTQLERDQPRLTSLSSSAPELRSLVPAAPPGAGPPGPGLRGPGLRGRASGTDPGFHLNNTAFVKGCKYCAKQQQSAEIMKQIGCGRCLISSFHLWFVTRPS